MDKYIVLKLSKEDLENSISGLSGLKPILQKNCLQANLDGQGKRDAEQLGKHFDTAINSMITLLSYMEMKEHIPTLNKESAGRNAKEKIKKERIS